MRLLSSLFVVSCFALTALASGPTTFQKKKEKITGSFSIETNAGKTFIVFSNDFKTKKGPDLQLVLSTLEFAKTNGKNAMKNQAISLGLLKSNKGAQRFEVPANIDLAKFKCVLIHCVKYDRLWGGASL